jgi:hypothetical protein
MQQHAVRALLDEGRGRAGCDAAQSVAVGLSFFELCGERIHDLLLERATAEAADGGSTGGARDGTSSQVANGANKAGGARADVAAPVLLETSSGELHVRGPLLQLNLT